MRIHVTDSLYPDDGSVEDQPVSATLAATAEALAVAASASASETPRADAQAGDPTSPGPGHRRARGWSLGSKRHA